MVVAIRAIRHLGEKSNNGILGDDRSNFFERSPEREDGMVEKPLLVQEAVHHGVAVYGPCLPPAPGGRRLPPLVRSWMTDDIQC